VRLVGPELSLTTRTSTVHVPGARASGHRRGDLLAVVILIALPVIIFGVPALLGHAVLPGDDLTQNFPLRFLAGRQIRGGQLPLYDPYIWGGAPLLAGWNAAAAYPLTFLFAVLPGTAAWTLNMIVTWAVAGLGMFSFLRALRLGSLPSLLGAVSFAFAGAMPAQVAHLGLVAGMSWVPVQLLGVLRLTEARGTASRLRWIAVLAGTFGLTTLAGEPRAIADAGVIVVIYAAWRVIRLGRRSGPAAASVAAGSVAAGLVLGVCLGAVQWLPGLAVIGTSQRGASSVALFSSGSLPHRWLLLMLVPDLLGGSGSLGQPAFFANYNLAEVTGYVGILPLVAAAALLGRLRLRARLPEWAVWHVMAVVGFVLALGGNTPAGSLLVHLPLFGGLRLQSRNLLVADLALAVLLACWADQPLGDNSRRFLRALGGRRADLETVLGVLPALAMIVVVVLGLTWGTGLLHWLRAGPGAAGAAGPLRPWLVPYALIGAAAIAFVIFGRHQQPRLRSRWLGGLIAVDLVVFTVLSVVAVLPSPGGASGPGPGTNAAAAPAPGPRPIAALGLPGRFAIYDPDQIAAPELPVLGAPDLNATSATPSVQGYTSLVDGFYAAATGAHQAMGEGQEVLAPRAVGDGTLDQLNTSALLTPSAYLITRAGAGPAAGPAGTGHRGIAANHKTTWYLGTPLRVSRLEVPDADARQDVAAGTQIGLMTAGGVTRWFAANAPSASRLAISLPHPVTGVAVVAQAGGRTSRLGPLSITDANGNVVVANGQLQDALVPPRWGYAGRDGSFAIFGDHLARGPLSLEALPGRPASGAWVRLASGSAANPTAAAVFSPHGIRVIRSVTAIAGWSAAWHPRHGRPVALAVGRAGLVQAVDVPAGRGVVTWRYQPPWFPAGFALSLAAAAFIVVLLAGCAACERRPRRTGSARGRRRDKVGPWCAPAGEGADEHGGAQRIRAGPGG
jgi:hypothetical protein